MPSGASHNSASSPRANLGKAFPAIRRIERLIVVVPARATAMRLPAALMAIAVASAVLPGAERREQSDRAIGERIKTEGRRLVEPQEQRRRQEQDALRGQGTCAKGGSVAQRRRTGEPQDHIAEAGSLGDRGELHVQERRRRPTRLPVAASGSCFSHTQPARRWLRERRSSKKNHKMPRGEVR
jgi:hypothetical protein